MSTTLHGNNQFVASNPFRANIYENVDPSPMNRVSLGVSPPPIPSVDAPEQTKEPEDAQKSGKLDAFHAYMSEQLADAGFRKSGSDKKAGFVAQSGRFKGMTQDEINQKLRGEFGRFGADQRAKYASIARGDDVAADGGGDLVARTGGREPTVGNATFEGLAEFEALQGGRRKDPMEGDIGPSVTMREMRGAENLLQEARKENPTMGKGDFSSAVGSGQGVLTRPDPTAPRMETVPRAKLSPEKMAQMEGRSVAQKVDEPGKFPGQ